MALPILNSRPHIEIKIPSKGVKAKFVPFAVGEEKILLMAQETKDSRQVMLAITQIIAICLIDDSIKVEDFTAFDVEYVYTKLFAASSKNIITLKYIEETDGKEYTVLVNLEDIEIDAPKVNKVIDLGQDGLKIVLKYPSLLASVSDIDDSSTKLDVIDAILIASIEKVYDNQEVYSDWTAEEFVVFFNTMPVRVIDELNDFFSSIPVLTHTISYKRDDGFIREVELRGINDFFTFAFQEPL